MFRRPLRSSGLIWLALLSICVSASPLLAQESKSAALTKELLTLLGQNKLDSVAALEAKPDGYVAALYYPGVQLLVVAAKYREPVLLNDRIAKKEYRDTYMDLNSASMPGSKYLVMDLGCDGLKATGGFDTYEAAGKQFDFNGDWKAQKLSEEEYQKAFADADARYVRMLQALIAHLKKPI
jgi:hypothetical protein